MGRFSAETETNKVLEIYNSVALGDKIGECGAVVYNIGEKIVKAKALPDADECYGCILRKFCSANQSID